MSTSPIFYCASFCGWTGMNPADYYAQGNTDADNPNGYACPQCSAQAREGLVCQVCALAPALRGFEECTPCLAADLIHNSPDLLAHVRRVHAGLPALKALEAEIARQLGAVVACGAQHVEMS